jgi:chromosome segregation ATPase
LSGGRTSARLDDLDIRCVRLQDSNTELRNQLVSAEREIESLSERVESLEHEATRDYGAELKEMQDTIDDLVQYILRRDGVRNLGRYARAHEEVQKVI